MQCQGEYRSCTSMWNFKNYRGRRYKSLYTNFAWACHVWGGVWCVSHKWKNMVGLLVCGGVQTLKNWLIHQIFSLFWSVIHVISYKIGLSKVWRRCSKYNSCLLPLQTISNIVSSISFFFFICQHRSKISILQHGFFQF